jgi:hypothetical protein
MPRGRAVGFRHVTASDQFGPGALRLEPRHHCLHVAWQGGRIGVGGHGVPPTGGLLLQGLPAVEQPLGIQASLQIPQPVSRVSMGFVGYPPQAGWLLGLRSDRGRQTWPVRAPSCRHVLPPVVGFPPRCVLGVRRHPRRIRRAFPVTGLLRLPVPWSTVARRFPPGAVSGLPLRCLRSCSPSAKVFHVQERLGLPKCLDVSLPACHGLRTPADLHNLAKSVALVWPSGAFTPSASATSLVEAVPALQGARSPLRPPGYSVDASPLLFAVCTTTTPPWTQDSIRVGG